MLALRTRPPPSRATTTTLGVRRFLRLDRSTGPVVDVAWLARAMGPSAEQLRIVDCSGLGAWARAHVPGAVALPPTVDDSFKEPRQPHAPLGAAGFEALMAALGVARTTGVVFYDGGGAGVTAARAWWLCRLHGFNSAYVLDGGWPAWVRSNAPVAVGQDHTPPPAVPAELAVVANTQPALLARLPEVAAAARSGGVQLVDARSAREFTGAETRGNRHGGHVPGAVNIPFNTLSVPAGTLLPAGSLQERFRAAGLHPDRRSIVYCQAGIRAAVVALALERAGFSDWALYEASMSEYQNRDDLPRSNLDSRGLG